MPEYKHKRYTGVRERGQHKYEINFLVNGKRHYETVYALTALEASKRRTRRMGELEDAPPKYDVYKKQLPIDGVFEVYRERNERVLDENTLKRAECVINHLVTFLRKRYPQVSCLHQLTLTMCKEFKQYLVGLDTKSPAGVNADIDRLRGIFNKLCEYEFVEHNFFRDVEKFDKKTAKPRQKHLPTDSEVKTILQLSQDDPSYAEITVYIIRTGRRIEETCSLLKTDVILGASGMPEFIRVRQEITKTDDMSLLPIDDELSRVVQKAMQKHPQASPLFTNVYGRRIASNSYRIYLDEICKAGKINARISPHCFRFYAVTRFSNCGVNPKDGMAVTGHTDMTTYLSYSRTTREGVMGALSKTRIGA